MKSLEVDQDLPSLRKALPPLLRHILLGDAPLHPMFPLIFLCHLCTSLLIVASPRQSALAALIAESNGHVM